MNQLPAVSTHLLPIGSTEAYLQRVNQIPLLSAEAEYDLATRWQEQGDLEAAQQLVLSHLRYVVRVAKGYLGYGLPLQDLIQEGTIGLMKAVKRFEPSFEVRLVSFAVHWIKAEIHEFVIKNWRIVKIATTKAQRKLFFNLRKAKKRLGWFSKEEVEAVARDLGVKTQEVLLMEARLNAHDTSFEKPSEDYHTTSKLLSAPAEYLPAPESASNPETQLAFIDHQKVLDLDLKQAIAKLDPRSQYILENRWLKEKKSTLQELGLHFNVSIERVRQLEKAALDKLKQLFSR